jgi:hypothetical protein
MITSCFPLLLPMLLASSWQLAAAEVDVNWCFPSHGVDYCTTTSTSIFVSFFSQGRATVGKIEKTLFFMIRNFVIGNSVH